MVITEAQRFWLESGFVLELLRQLPAYVFWKDKNSIYLGCNDAFAHSLGLSSPAEIIGKTDYDLPTTREESDSFRADDQEIIKSKRSKLNFEEHQTLANGKKVILLTNKVPLFDKQKNVIGILGIYHDITGRKKEEEELRKAKELAEVSSKLKTEFIRNMEHDIRTPFSGIYGMAKILHDNEEDEKKKNYLNDIVNSAKELLDYSTAILNFSRMEASSTPLIAKKFNLPQLIQGLLMMETPAAKLKNLDFSIYLDPDLPSVVIGDRYRLQRILINLISNAIKFTEQGFVKLSVKVAKKIDKKHAILSFRVEDSGIGIAEESRDIIFERFTRLVPANKGLYHGQGLGLSLVKQLVEEMEGDIEVISEIGKGSTFMFTLDFKLPLVDDLLIA